MKNLPEAMAERFYDLHQRQIFLRTNFATTTLQSKLWKDLQERDRAEYLEAFRQLLADKEIMQILKNRSEL